MDEALLVRKIESGFISAELVDPRLDEPTHHPEETVKINVYDIAIRCVQKNILSVSVTQTGASSSKARQLYPGRMIPHLPNTRAHPRT
jgi:hypothetical protein